MLRVIFSPSMMDTRKISRKWLDIPYADQSPAQKLDIYLPEKGEGPFPVIVSIHAGAWMFGDKRDVTNRPMLEGLKRGFALVCIDYRLSGEAKFPTQIHDCKAAIRYIRANAATYQLDGSRIVACGGSAAGHLAALLGTSAGIKELEDLSMGNTDVSAAVQAVVCWCSPLEDFLNIDPELRENGVSKADHNEEYSPESKLLGTSITNVPDLVRSASPMTYIRPDVPPFFIQHGSADREVPPQQSIRFAAEVEKIAGRDKVSLEIMKGAGHGDRAFETDANVAKMFDFIERQVNKKQVDQQMIPPMMDTSHIKRKWLNRQYANQSPTQKLDIYLPDDGDGPFPVIAAIHGGAWMLGDKADILNLPMLEGLKRGYAVVCINYRLSGEAQFPSQIFDCKAAIRFIRGNATVYNLDANRIGAWGASAGGHLVALLGTTARVRKLEDFAMGNPRSSSKVQAVISWYGPLESFLTMDEELAGSGMGRPDHSGPDSPESRLLGGVITAMPEMVRFASPMTHIKPYAPPFLVQHGAKDEIVPVEQSIRFAEKYAQIAGSEKVTLEILENARHADPIFETPQNVKRVLDFLDAHLK